MTTRIATTSFLLLAAVLLLPSSITSAEVTGACLKDAKSLCAGVQPGGGKIRDCLKSHIKDLSDGCQAVVLKAVNAKACADDVKQFCADTKPGEGRVEACMKAHVAEVSDACKVAMANAAAGED
jgi:cysteine rich repeat protein